MKYIFNIIFILFSVCVFGQSVPDSINYQAVIRTSTGAIATSTNVNMKFELFEGSTSVYTETVILNANSAGIVTHFIGGGTLSSGSGSFSGINWEGGDIWYQASVLDGGLYNPIGVKQKFMTVPYSFYAKKSYNSKYADEVSSFTVTPGVLTIGSTTVPLTSGTTYTAGSGINISGTTISNTLAPINPTITGSGITSIVGTYPNLTITTPTTTVYTPSTGIAISPGGVITNTLPAITTTIISGSASFTVTPNTSMTSYILTPSTYSLSQSTDSIRLMQNGSSISSVSVSPGGIYGGSGVLTFSSTIASIGTNSLTFNSFRIPATSSTLSSITNFLNVGGADAFINISSNTYSKAGAKFLGNGTELYGSIFGHTKGVTVSAGPTYTNALTTSTLGDVWINAVPSATTEGRMVITHPATLDSYPSIHLKSNTSSYNRIKFNNNYLNHFFEIASYDDGDPNNSSFSINQYNGTNYKSVFLINTDRKVYINDYNLPLTAFHVMTNNATAPNGIMSEGFAQPGKLSLSRNNNTGGGIRSAVTNNQSIGELLFSGSDGTLTGMKNGATIKAISTENFTSTSYGTDLIFSTVPNTYSTSINRMAIRNTGEVEILKKLVIPSGADLQIASAPTLGAVLTSDAAGNATWQLPVSGPWTKLGTSISTTTLGDYVGIGISTPSYPLHLYSNSLSPTSYIENNSSGYAIYAKSGSKAIYAFANGNQSTFTSENSGTGASANFTNTTASTSDEVIIDNNGIGAGLRINSSSTSTVGLHLNGGHIKTSGINPTWSSTVTALTSSNVIGSDVAGRVSFTTSGSILANQEVINVTFNKAYKLSNPIIILTPYTASAVSTSYYVELKMSGSDCTGFIVKNKSPELTTGTFTFNYFVIE